MDHPHPLSTTWWKWRCWWTLVCSRSEETLRRPAGVSLSWMGSKSKVEFFPTLAATAPDWIVERYPQGAVTPDSTTVLQYHVHHNDIVSFFHHLRDTFKVFFVLEPGDLDDCARRTLSLPIASKSHLTFSNLTLTQDHVLNVKMLLFFFCRHKLSWRQHWRVAVQVGPPGASGALIAPHSPHRFTLYKLRHPGFVPKASSSLSL